MCPACKGICESFKASSISYKFRYDQGQKRCTFCDIFIEFNGIRCPCCGCPLRIKARTRNSIAKKYFLINE